MDVYLMDVHLMGVYFKGVHLNGVYLINVHLTGVHLMKTSRSSWSICRDELQNTSFPSPLVRVARRDQGEVDGRELNSGRVVSSRTGMRKGKLIGRVSTSAMLETRCPA